MQPQTTPRRPAKAATTAAPSERARLIRLVHVGRRELSLTEVDYRAILQAQGGAESSASMSVGQLQRVVDYLRRQGFKVATKAKTAAAAGALKAGPVAVALASDPESRKARAMWLTLHAIGQVRDPSEAALLRFAKRMCKVDRLEWVRDMLPLIEALKAWLLRSLPAYVTPYLKIPSTQWAPHMGDAWRTNWDQAVRQLRFALEAGHVQVLDQWVSLWSLAESAELEKKAGKAQ
jgi:phage gp16-like protein